MMPSAMVFAVDLAGSYDLTVDGAVLITGGEFAESETTEFLYW